MKKLLATCFAVLLLAGCATRDEWQPDTGNMIFKVQARSYDDVWTAAIRTISRNLTIRDTNKAQGRILAETSAGMVTSSEVITVVISPANRNASSYTIDIQNRKRSMGLISGPDQIRNIVAGIKAELGSMASTGPVSLKDSLSPSEEVITVPLADPAPQAPAVTGELTVQVEQLARQSGCQPTSAARLIAKTTGVETYQTSCQNGQQALFKCEMRQCRRLD
ncbi:hypothetical protein [Glaciimonas immobilis]|uniref:Lipoprotein n=1 Tax=Glaciimonas immobilis TaxID=728004 RepID=A0A840RTN0_9BURK|nr:hypothetical protein [Glaciimonas immobilis]KAF3996985.1 hypothetical protein HAV38_14990 [Glaciimonas immobilis]MBB5199819.1 hypothetical protein [Glaciimonas immobilis]